MKRAQVGGKIVPVRADLCLLSPAPAYAYTVLTLYTSSFFWSFFGTKSYCFSLIPIWYSIFYHPVLIL
jgi:hypothetical protein